MNRIEDNVRLVQDVLTSSVQNVLLTICLGSSSSETNTCFNLSAL